MADNSPNTLTLPGKAAQTEVKAESERKVDVILTHDVWIDAPDHPESIEGILRIRTNVPVLDPDGNPVVDKKSKTAVTTLTTASLPISVAKKLIDEGKAKRADPL